MPTSEKRPLQVFLSYASQDKPAVRELSRRLAGEGWIDPWVDEKKLLPGQDWRTKIEEAVEASDIVIICLSSNSVTKEGFVQKELRYAREIAFEKPDGTIFLIPLRLDECTVPRGLRFYQWADYFGAGKETAYQGLLEALHRRYEQKLSLEERRVEHENASPDKRQAYPLVTPKDGTSSGSFETFGSTIRKVFPFLRLAGITGIVIALFWMGARPLLNLSSLMAPPTNAETSFSSATQAFTDTPASAAKTITPAPTLEPTKVPTPTTYVGPLPTEITDSEGMQMVLVPAGAFSMGTDNSSSEKPVHEVSLDAFYIDKYEVTNAAYKTCVDRGECPWPQNILGPTNSLYYDKPEFVDYPVLYVNWIKAKTYCEWRGARLPNEAEWEKAARGTDGRTYPWGEGIGCRDANYANCVGYTTVVGSYEDDKSPYGAYDMAGNAAEWVSDWFSSTYYQTSPAFDPPGPDSGTFRVSRGGSWTSYEYYSRVYKRRWYDPASASNEVGFRCATDASP